MVAIGTGTISSTLAHGLCSNRQVWEVTLHLEPAKQVAGSGMSSCILLLGLYFSQLTGVDTRHLWPEVGNAAVIANLTVICLSPGQFNSQMAYKVDRGQVSLPNPQRLRPLISATITIVTLLD